MNAMVTRAKEFFARGPAHITLTIFNAARSFAALLPRLLLIAVRSIFDEHLMLRTMSLVYTTLLSLIPLLAVSFSLGKVFDLHIRMEGVISNALAPLGPAGTELAQRIITTVERVDLSILGAIGFIFLLYKSIFLIYKIERALNYIWRVESTRNLLRRFGDYIIALLIGPVLILTAIGITFSLMSTSLMQWLISVEPLGSMLYAAGELIPFLIVAAVFTFTYILLPDTKVRFGSALVGGIIAGAAWEAAGWAFAAFTVSSAEYSAVYSGFAIPILFLMWLYMSWFILLIGAQIAFYHQYPQLISAPPQDILSTCRSTERLSLSVMFLIGDHFNKGKAPWTRNELAKRLGVAPGEVQNVLRRLEQKGVIVSTRNKPFTYHPARAIEIISLKEILAADGTGTGNGHGKAPLSSLPEIDTVFDDLDAARTRLLDDTTLKDLVLSGTRERHGEPIPWQ